MRVSFAIRRFVISAVALALLAGCGQEPPPAVTAEPLEGPALVEALTRGGYVLFLRHATTDSSYDQGAPPQVTDCGRQRNLSTIGREESERIGGHIRDLGIAVGEVRASPYCRTVDTATLAFGDDVVEDERLLSGESSATAAALDVLLAERPERGNTVLVGHGSNLGAATGVDVAEAEMAVFAPLADEGYALVARIPFDAWAALAD